MDLALNNLQWLILSQIKKKTQKNILSFLRHLMFFLTCLISFFQIDTHSVFYIPNHCFFFIFVVLSDFKDFRQPTLLGGVLAV